MNKFLNALQERQFWVMVGGLLAVFGVSLSSSVDPDKLIDAITLIVSIFVGGTSLKDGLVKLLSLRKTE